MKKPARHTHQSDGQMLFTYRRTLAERLASGDLRDVSSLAKPAGFHWRLAATKRLFCDVEAVPRAYGRTESVRRRWQHLFLLASPVAAQLRKDSTKEKEINVVLRTTDAPERSREHIKSLVLRRETAGDGLADMLLLAYQNAGGVAVGRCYVDRRFSIFLRMSSSPPSPDNKADGTTRTVHPSIVRLVEWRKVKGWTQEQTAAHLEIRLNTLKSYECGNRNLGGASTEKILNLIGLPGRKSA